MKKTKCCDAYVCERHGEFSYDSNIGCPECFGERETEEEQERFLQNYYEVQ